MGEWENGRMGEWEKTLLNFFTDVNFDVNE